jgi:sulfoxide reductase heme-binding subunit YedZ
LVGGYALALLAGVSVGITALLVYAFWLGRSPSPISWYLARASGIVLYMLTWVAVMTGLGLTTALLDRWPGRGIVFSLHAFATQLTYGVLALHLLSLAADPTVNFGPRELLVPFASTVREPWTGFGVLAGQLILLSGVSFTVKRVIGQRAWRALHWLMFPLYALALLHGLGAGTDAGSLWQRGLYLLTAAGVILFGSYRVLRRRPRASTPQGARPESRRGLIEHAHPDR